jgi:hypothetical protein
MLNQYEINVKILISVKLSIMQANNGLQRIISNLSINNYVI